MTYQEFMNGIAAPEVFHHFYNLSQVPRCSGNYEPICTFLADFAKGLGLRYEIDEAHNVIMWKPASPDMSDRPPVMMTAHTDMVCVKTNDSDHDFSKDPLCLIREGDIIRADRTTLGADDGLGMAMIMAVLSDDKISHPAIEAVFTSDEETDMGGALGLDFSQFKSKTVLNLDGFAIGCSCTGEEEVHLHMPLVKTAVDPGACQIRLIVDGLKGGHTGISAMEQRGNGILLLNRVLLKLRKTTAFKILDYYSESTNPSAFAAYASCDLAVSPASMEEVKAVAAFCDAQLKTELKDRDPGVRVRWEELSEKRETAFSDETATNLMHFLAALPDGIITFSAALPGRLELSSNLGAIRVKTDEIFMGLLIRNRVASVREYMEERIRCLSRTFGCVMEVEHVLSQWDMNMSDELAATLAEIYPDKEFEHFDGTLECGIFSSNLKGSSVTSLAPTFYENHSPDEHIFISETAVHQERLIKLLSRL